MRSAFLKKYKRGDIPLVKDYRFVTLYGLFSESDGKIRGYIENSFSMSFSDVRVRAWRLEDAEYYLKKFITKQSYAKAKGIDYGRKYFIYRLTRKSPDAMITCDFSEWKQSDIRNFKWRNIPFIYNGGGSSTL